MEANLGLRKYLFLRENSRSIDNMYKKADFFNLESVHKESRRAGFADALNIRQLGALPRMMR